MTPWLLIPAIYLAASAATFLAFALDKRAASLGRRRTPERTLHFLELLGGWPGAFLAMWLVRHKNRKPAYMAITAVVALGHAAAWIASLWLKTRGDAP